MTRGSTKEEEEAAIQAKPADWCRSAARTRRTRRRWRRLPRPAAAATRFPGPGSAAHRSRAGRRWGWPHGRWTTWGLCLHAAAGALTAAAAAAVAVGVTLSRSGFRGACDLRHAENLRTDTAAAEDCLRWPGLACTGEEVAGGDQCATRFSDEALVQFEPTRLGWSLLVR